MRIPPVLMLTLFMTAGPAWAWEEHVFLDQGVAIQFPVKPQTQTSSYNSIFAKGLPSMVYSAEDDHVVYKLTVVDLTKRPPETGPNFLNEVGYQLMRKGTVLFTDFPRVYQGAKSVYGITLVVDRKDGSRVRDSFYYHKGRLYIAEAAVLPARGDKDMTTPSRYDQTIRFPPDGRFD